MAIFAPVYRPSAGQQGFLARQQKRERKRRRDGEASESEDEDATLAFKQSPEPDEGQRTASFIHPVHKTDPYHVAGHPREVPLPPAPFPHAPVLDWKPAKKPAEEELAALNPPLYVAKESPEDRSTSSKRRHIDNLTTVLHTCMLRGDWPRASRAWALLLRTETAGRGMDVRQHGRWGIGAELLMRQRQKHPVQAPPFASPAGSDQPQGRTANVPTDYGQPAFTDEGFRLAREYYERLILQYPHTPRTQHTVNAVAFYPALFNIWIYEAQDRSKRARQRPDVDRPVSSSGSERSADFSTTSSTRGSAAAARQQELEEALPVAQRMDELMLSPPYDTSLALLQLRGMVGLWISDLYTSNDNRAPSDDEQDVLQRIGCVEAARSRKLAARQERERARGAASKVRAAGGELPIVMAHLLESDDEEGFT
ncbi:hypothetical protein LTR85_008619 [Meristemomyces frigidus]|nr:hypothetical protein LTR85_008619 [Meristemomyces frigidus]